MAYSDMNDFLKRYFRQMHVNHMPPAVIDRLNEDYANGILNEDQLDWINKYFTVSNGKLVKNALPDPALDSELEPDTQAKKLYVEMAKTLAKMKGVSHLYTLGDKDATDFLERWFDKEKLSNGEPAFAIPQANDQAEASIKPFLDLLGYGDRTLSAEEQEVAEQIKQTIRENTFKDDGTTKLFDDQYAVKDFLDKCKQGKYNTDHKVQDKLLKVANALKNYLLNHYEQREEIEYIKEINSIYQHLENIGSDNAFNKIDITPENLKEFRKDKLPIILKTLYENPTVRAKFKDHDQSKIITDQLEKYSENKVNWQNPQSDNYIKPKVSDVRSPLEWLKKWTGDTYDNTLRKYEELRGGHMFFGAHAKEVCKAIDKEKVKPVDGVKGLLAKKDAIKKRFTNKNVEKHFDWFTQTMETLTQEIPNAVEGCWKNARQMKCVIQNIILKATDPRTATEDDFEKAKTAMEIMTVMKYGMMTSKIMDAMKSTEFSIFSDGDLSWNKNEGIKFVTRAFDKSIKYAFLGVGYGVTFVRNKIMMRNMNFSDKNNQKGPLQDRVNTIKTSSTYDKQKTQDSLNDHRSQLTQKQNALNNWVNSNGTQQQIEQRIQAAQNGMNGLQNKHDEYERYKRTVDDATDRDTKISEAGQNIATKEQEVQEAWNAYTNNPAYQNIPDMLREERRKEAYLEWERLNQELDNLKQTKTDLENQRNSNLANVAAARQGMNQLQGDYDQYNQLATKHQEQVRKKEQFEKQTATINEINTAITNEQNALATWDQDHQNKVIELENYWNFLQSGKSKTWRLFTKRAQDKFDSNKQQMLQDYIQNYGLAA